MAMVSRTCPSCGATVNIDDEKEFGFCEQCGAKIMRDETAAEAPAAEASDTEAADTEVAATQAPAVETPAPAIPGEAAGVPATLDPAAAAAPDTSALLVDANRSFDERNFADAYEKYTKVLAAAPHSYDALYRSAICSAYLAASGDPDVGSFEASMGSAVELLKSGQAVTGKSYVDASSAKDLDITNMLISMFSAGRASDTTQSCLDNCKIAYENWLKTASFAYKAVSYIEKESFKQTALSSAIDFCDFIKNKEMSYLAGMDTSEDGGVSKPIYKTYTPQTALSSKFVKLRGELAEAFNTLPSRVARRDELNTNIQTISESVKSLKEQIRTKSSELSSASKSFWDAHPEQRKERSTMRIKSLVILGVAALIAVFLYLVKYPIYAAAAAVLGAVITFAKIKHDTKKYDEKVLSFDVKLIQSDLDTLNSKLSVEEASLKEKQKALTDFEKTNK